MTNIIIARACQLLAVSMLISLEMNVMADEKKNTRISATNPEEIKEMISQAAAEIDKKNKNKARETRPPWEVMPDTQWPSMAWRMGAGEDVMHEFRNYFGSLSPMERNSYIVGYPEPPGWDGFYKIVIERLGK